MMIQKPGDAVCIFHTSDSPIRVFGARQKRTISAAIIWRRLQSIPIKNAERGWISDVFEVAIPHTLLGERLDFHDYQIAAEKVVEQLREALELTGEELRKHTAFKPNFCGFLETYGRASEHLLDSFQEIRRVIEALLATMFARGTGRATSHFKDQQATRLLKAYACLQKEKDLHHPAPAC